MNSNMNMRYRVHLSEEVRDALAHGSPVIALESSILCHGMPYPQSVNTALACERIARQHGAVPAICAVIGGKLYAGLTDEQIEYLGKQGKNVEKANCRDLPILIAKKRDGVTTVAASMLIASIVGIKIFAASSIGGIHRGAQTAMDVSSDLHELARIPMAVVCAGIKGVLDIERTLEYLETMSVPVVGFRTSDMPAFYTRTSGFKTPARVDTIAELSTMVDAMIGLKLGGGLVIANPIPQEYAMEPAVVDRAIERALRDADERGVSGKALTPYLLERISELTGGQSLKTNIALMYNNVRLAAQLAGGRGEE